MVVVDGADGLVCVFFGRMDVIFGTADDEWQFFWVDKRIVFPLHFFNALTASSEIALKWR